MKFLIKFSIFAAAVAAAAGAFRAAGLGTAARGPPPRRRWPHKSKIFENFFSDKVSVLKHGVAELPHVKRIQIAVLIGYVTELQANGNLKNFSQKITIVTLREAKRGSAGVPVAKCEAAGDTQSVQEMTM